jgi:hypothetical protein
MRAAQLNINALQDANGHGCVVSQAKLTYPPFSDADGRSEGTNVSTDYRALAERRIETR